MFHGIVEWIDVKMMGGEGLWISEFEKSFILWVSLTELKCVWQRLLCVY